MKKILGLILCLCLLITPSISYASEIDAEFLSLTMDSILAGGDIACESYLDGKFNESISKITIDLENKRIEQIVFNFSMLDVSPDGSLRPIFSYCRNKKSR